MSKMIIPRVGDIWEFRLPSGHKVTKKIDRIFLMQGKGPGRLRIQWDHVPKARWLPIYSPKALFHERTKAKRINTKWERDEHRKKHVEKWRAGRAVTPGEPQ